MTTIYEIPLSPAPQTLAVTIGGTPYNLRFLYHNCDQGGWAMDISDASQNPLVCGIPLVTGADLLAQYGHVGIGGSLYVQSDGDASSVPTFGNLGVASHLYLVAA
jgi:hypothetical protein